MDKEKRIKFNEEYNSNKYADLLHSLNLNFPPIPFRVAESPFFLTHNLIEKLVEAGQQIIDFIKLPNFKSLTERAIPTNWYVQNENEQPHFISIDFGICLDSDGSIVPKLIELQGFPSLLCFQPYLAQNYHRVYELDSEWQVFSDRSKDELYVDKIKKIIIGDCNPEQVIMLDYQPEEQATAIDFYLTQQILGLKVLCVKDIIVDGLDLFYKEENGLKPIKRIYNRLIFDELEPVYHELSNGFDPRIAYQVEWITHPNWFYRISKFLLPLLNAEFVPESHFLNDLDEVPSDLENYVLKPLFSFAGQGIKLHVERLDLESIKDPENWILQRKVTYAPVLNSPNGQVKAEIRLMYIWADNSEPELIMNLTRLSKGEMIGVRYNMGMDWVGGSVSFMKTNP